MSKTLEEASKQLSIPVESLKEGFDSLISKGIIFTPAKSANEFTFQDFPIRIAGQPPNFSNSSSITLGPFPVERKKYETIFDKFSEDDLMVLLSLAKLSYEKTGEAFRNDGYEIEIPNDNEEHFYDVIVAMIELFDLSIPIIRENFVWFVPKNEHKSKIEKMTGKNFAPNDFSWWDVQTDLGEIVMLKTLADYPDSVGFFPAELINSWEKYLPSIASFALLHIYIKTTTGKKTNEYTNLNDFLQVIKKGITWGDSINQDEESDSINTDRELLIKELCDYNKLPYPTDATTLFDYLCKVGLVTLKQEKGGIVFSLTEKIRNADSVFSLPDDWAGRMEKYLVTGNILSSYLSLKEVLEK